MCCPTVQQDWNGSSPTVLPVSWLLRALLPQRIWGQQACRPGFLDMQRRTAPAVVQWRYERLMPMVHRTRPLRVRA